MEGLGARIVRLKVKIRIVMNKIQKNEISIYVEAIPNAFCDRIIREFHKGFALGEVIEGVVSAEGVEEYRSDDFLVAKDIQLVEHVRWDKFNAKLHRDYIRPCLRDYLQDFKYVLEEESLVDPESCIISLYEKNKGHFCPHQDSVANMGVHRSLTVICYLNTVVSAGTTYFFNQDFRVSPFTGNVVIFPSNFVYGHMGETPKSGDKYITVSFATIDVGDASKVKHYENND